MWGGLTSANKPNKQPLSPACPQYPCWVLLACRHGSTTDVFIKETCLLHSTSWKPATPFCSAQQILYQNLLRARWETLRIKGLWNGKQRHRRSQEIHKEPMSMYISYKRKPNFKDLSNLDKCFIDTNISPEMGFLRNQYFKIITQIQCNLQRRHINFLKIHRKAILC